MKKQRGFIEGGVVILFLIAAVVANSSGVDPLKKAEEPKVVATSK